MEDAQPDEDASLERGDQLKVGREGLLARLVAQERSRQQGGGRASEQREPKKIAFADPPRAGPRPFLVLPKGQERPEVHDRQEGENPGKHVSHGAVRLGRVG